MHIQTRQHLMPFSGSGAKRGILCGKASLTWLWHLIYPGETGMVNRLSTSPLLRLIPSGHHEENQVAVLKWLTTTSIQIKRQWLLVFDNAGMPMIPFTIQLV